MRPYSCTKVCNWSARPSPSVSVFVGLESNGVVAQTVISRSSGNVNSLTGTCFGRESNRSGRFANAGLADVAALFRPPDFFGVGGETECKQSEYVAGVFHGARFEGGIAAERTARTRRTEDQGFGAVSMAMR